MKKIYESISLKSPAVLLILIILSASFCRKKMYSEEMQDCDNFANYYENGEHFIRRDLVTDEGVVDRKKMFEEYKQKNSNCYPTKKMRGTRG